MTWDGEKTATPPKLYVMAVGVNDYYDSRLRLSYAVSAIHPENVGSRRVAERSGAYLDGQMHVIGLTWERYLWPLAAGGETRLQPVSGK